MGFLILSLFALAQSCAEPQQTVQTMHLFISFPLSRKKTKRLQKAALQQRHPILVWGLRMGAQVESLPGSLCADRFSGIQQAKWNKKNDKEKEQNNQTSYFPVRNLLKWDFTSFFFFLLWIKAQVCPKYSTIKMWICISLFPQKKKVSKTLISFLASKEQTEESIRPHKHTFN